jgi:hypothetical protein
MAALIAELRQQFNDEKKEYKMWYMVDAILRQQLLNATDDRFVSGLKHPIHGYALVTVKALMDFLTGNHGHITVEMLPQNDEGMRQTWSGAHRPPSNTSTHRSMMAKPSTRLVLRHVQIPN